MKNKTNTQTFFS